jgi:hypothetical protein
MHLSYSQIAMYLDCGRRWQGHYKQDLKAPVGEALFFGTQAHKAFQAFITDNTIDMATVWTENWKKAIVTEEYKHVVWDETPATAFTTGLRMLRSQDVIDVLSTIKPKMHKRKVEHVGGGEVLSTDYIDSPMIEREIHWTLDGMPDIIGYIDCIQDDGVPIDFKTAGKMWAADKAGKEIQPLFYLAALTQLGEMDHQFRFRHVVVTKAKTPRIEVFEEQRNPVEFEYMEAVVRGVWAGISNAVFVPNPTSWLCDPKYCGAYYACVGKGR